MVLIFGLIGMAAAAVAVFNRMVVLEPDNAQGVTQTIKGGVINAIVSGMASTICALLGVRTGQIQNQPLRGRYTQQDWNE